MARSRPMQGRKTQDRGRRVDFGVTSRRVAGEYVSNLRQRAGITQLEIAKALGMRDAAISAVEVGRNSLPPERLAAWADILGVNRREFAKTLLRSYDPWMFSALFPKELPEEALEGLPERIVDHRK